MVSVIVFFFVCVCIVYIGKCSYYIYIFKKVSILCENIHFFAATKQILSLNFFYYLFLIWLLVLCVVCARAYVLFPLLIYTYMNVSTAMAARDDLWTEGTHAFLVSARNKMTYDSFIVFGWSVAGKCICNACVHSQIEYNDLRASCKRRQLSWQW